MRIRKSAAIGTALSIALISATAFSQDSGQSQSITFSSYAAKRPAEAGSANSAGIASIGRQGVFKFIRPERGPAGHGAAAKRPSKTAPPKPKTSRTVKTPKNSRIAEETADLGVTVWRLRPPLPSDRGRKLPVKTESGTAMWTPERVGPDTKFAPGDRVRFAVESTKPGYLYIFNSEAYADGRTGRPCLIFPGKPGDGNYVLPGLPVDFPDQGESLPYFRISPKGAGYSGEMLSVILSPKPLSGLNLQNSDGCAGIDSGELSKLGENSSVELYSRTDTDDQTYTDAEAQSVCGGKTRELVREKTENRPCGERTRQLTRDEPLPQSVYRIKVPAKQPAVAVIRLEAGK